MKKSNNKRTKRLRLKYKKTKTKRNIKRRTLRKTRHRQRVGGGLPTTTILPSASTVGRLIVKNVLSSMRQGAHKLGQETIKAVESTLNPKTVNPFTIGHHTAAPIPVLRKNFFDELIETIKTKAKGKLVKKSLENCLFGEDEKAELAAEGVRYAKLYSTRRADASFKDFKKPSQYPINISSANLKLLQKEINIEDDDLHNDKEVKDKIEQFVDTIISEEISQCTPKKKKSASPVLSPGNVDMPPHVRIKSNRSRQHLLEEEASVKRTLNF